MATHPPTHPLTCPDDKNPAQKQQFRKTTSTDQLSNGNSSKRFRDLIEISLMSDTVEWPEQ
jgi:hypothetical protein